MKHILIIFLCFFAIKATSQCNNVTNAGEIGIHEPCQYGHVPSRILSIEDASGGDTSNVIEYLWLFTTDSNTVNGTAWNNVAAIHFSYDPTYQHQDQVFMPTWFRRCARRQGCANYTAESNWIQVLAPNSALPIKISELNNTYNIIQWKLEDKSIFKKAVLYGSYCRADLVELISTTNNYFDISKLEHIYFQVVFYDLDDNITRSKIIHINRKNIITNELNGKEYIIYNINGSIIRKGIFYNSIQLQPYEIIKFN